jgi:hypothetical protein
VLFPRFEARVEPDTFLLGFDLTEDQARGAEPGDPGWFFVLKERPGDPRFGLDVERTGLLQVWSDLAWSDVLVTPPNGTATHLTLRPGGPTPVLDPLGPDDGEKEDQRLEDTKLSWRPGIGSADVAYLLFQSPVLMAVHAKEMLRDA